MNNRYNVGERIYVLRLIDIGDGKKKGWVVGHSPERILSVQDKTYQTSDSFPDFVSEENVFPNTSWEKSVAECNRRNKRLEKKNG